MADALATAAATAGGTKSVARIWACGWGSDAPASRLWLTIATALACPASSWARTRSRIISSAIAHGVIGEGAERRVVAR